MTPVVKSWTRLQTGIDMTYGLNCGQRKQEGTDIHTDDQQSMT